MSAGVGVHAGRMCSFTDVKIKTPGSGDVNDVMHRKRAEDFGDFEKVS